MDIYGTEGYVAESMMAPICSVCAYIPSSSCFGRHPGTYLLTRDYKGWEIVLLCAIYVSKECIRKAREKGREARLGVFFSSLTLLLLEFIFIFDSVLTL